MPLIELDFTKMPDGSVVAIFEEGDKYLVAAFDNSDVTVWENEVDSEVDAWNLYRKAASGGVVGYP